MPETKERELQFKITANKQEFDNSIKELKNQANSTANSIKNSFQNIRNVITNTFSNIKLQIDNRQINTVKNQIKGLSQDVEVDVKANLKMDQDKKGGLGQIAQFAATNNLQNLSEPFKEMGEEIKKSVTPVEALEEQIKTLHEEINKSTEKAEDLKNKFQEVKSSNNYDIRPGLDVFKDYKKEKANLDSLKQTLEVEKKLKKQIDDTTQSTDENTESTEKNTQAQQKNEKAVNKSANSFKNLVKSMLGIGSLYMVVSKSIQFMKDSITAASDLEEQQNVVDTVFGSMSQDCEEFAKTAINSFGISELSAKKMAGTFMAMAGSTVGMNEKAKEMSINLAKLSADMSSFYNVSTDVASTALKSVFTGETESLKKFGIVLTEANLNNYMYQQGLKATVQQLDESSKAQLRYAFIMDKMKNVQGDFAKTSNSWANQTRLLSEQFTRLKTAIGQDLMQAFLPVIKFVNELLVKITEAYYRFKAFLGIKTEPQQNGIVQSGNKFEQSMGNALTDVKEIAKTLAGFDEINILGNKDSSTSIPSGSLSYDFTPLTGSYELPQINQNFELDEKTKLVIDGILGFVDIIAATIKSIWGAIQTTVEFFKNWFADFKLIGEGISEWVKGIAEGNSILKNDGQRKTEIGIVDALIDLLVFFQKLGIELAGWFLKVIATIKHPLDAEAREKEYAEIDKNVEYSKENIDRQAEIYKNDSRNKINAKYEKDPRLKKIIDQENEDYIKRELDDGSYLLNTQKNIKQTISQIHALGHKSDAVITTIRKQIAGVTEDGVVNTKKVTKAMEDNILGFGDLMALGYSYEEAMALAGDRYNQVTSVTNQNLDQSKWKTDAFKQSIEEANGKMNVMFPNTYFKEVKDGADGSTGAIKNSSLAMDGFNIGTGKALTGAKNSFSTFVSDWNNRFGTLKNAIDLKVNDATQSGKNFWKQFKQGAIYEAQSNALNFKSTAITPAGNKLTTTNVITAYAKGGVLTEPTLGLLGEYAGAKSNPEIVTPESKMREVFTDVNGQLASVISQCTQQVITQLAGMDLSVTIGDEAVGQATQRYANTYKKQTGMAFI